MTTGRQTQPDGEEPESDGPRWDAGGEPSERGTRGLAISAALLLLLAMGVRTVVAVKRTRSRVHDLPSVIRIAAAPHSVVYVVSAAKLGRSHLEMPLPADPIRWRSPEERPPAPLFGPGAPPRRPRPPLRRERRAAES